MDRAQRVLCPRCEFDVRGAVDDLVGDRDLAECDTAVLHPLGYGAPGGLGRLEDAGTVDEHARGKQGHHAPKYAQDLRYMSPEWREVYATLRNTIEGFHAYSKTPNEENLEEPARRRLRGRSMQAFLVPVTIAASNIRKIRSFMERQSKPGHVPGAAKKRLRPPTGLQAYRPDLNAPPAAIPA